MRLHRIALGGTSSYLVAGTDIRIFHAPYRGRLLGGGHWLIRAGGRDALTEGWLERHQLHGAARFRTLTQARRAIEAAIGLEVPPKLSSFDVPIRKVRAGFYETADGQVTISRIASGDEGGNGWLIAQESSGDTPGFQMRAGTLVQATKIAQSAIAVSRMPTRRAS